MELERITPEEAQAAYAATGLRPLSGMYFTDNYPKQSCGCPAFVVAVYRTGKTIDELRMDAMNEGRSFNSLDLVDNTWPESYLMGFVSAVDGRPGYPQHSPDPAQYEEGREDGHAVAAVVFPAVEAAT